MNQRILALNPWHGGAHRAFLESWISHSRHDFQVLSLPPTKWKWRMRHGAVTLAAQLREMGLSDFDALFCTDMLNLAEFCGLAPEWARQLPAIVYFHENQLTYPVREEKERDLHFGFSNIATCLAADEVWFNSEWHCGEFLRASRVLLSRMPDYGDARLVDFVQDKSVTQPPGIELCPLVRPKSFPRPLQIVWVGRWEHDKNPELFFESLFELKNLGVDFRINVLGESFSEVPPVFLEAREQLSDHIDRWGFAESRDTYWRTLTESEVVISTANHEFFGIAILEAVSAGCFPLVPNNLAYPETLCGFTEDVFHDGTVSGLVNRLESLALSRPETPASSKVTRFSWLTRAGEMDQRIDDLVRVTRASG